jgi:CheY-like chemotaxis protein
MKRVLKPNGKMSIIEIDPNTGRGKRLKICERILHTGAKFYEPFELKRKVEDHGLKVLSVKCTNLGYFLEGLEESNTDVNKKIEVYTSNNPVEALSEFKPNFYDLLLVDINMPYMNVFELSEKILSIDINVKVCYMSSAEIHREALREIYPAISIGSFIRKPVTIDYLVKRIMSELD